jgi:uncharacterized repeat protein (TIGR01451 family)
VPQISWAVGTPSGTTISNSATLTFAIGASPPTTTTSNIVSFTVDDKVNVTVAGGVITSVSPGQNGVLTPFTVTNTGNATQGYNLVAADAASGVYTVNATAITDDFNPAAGYTIYRDNNCDGLIDGADALVTIIPTLAAGATACLLVQTNIAPTQVIGDAAVVSLKASTLWPSPNAPFASEEPAGATAGGAVNPTTYPSAANTAGVDVLFADNAGVVDAAGDGAHSTFGAFHLNGVSVTLTKTVASVLDPNGTAVLMPGAVMTYQIAVAVSGSGTATNLVITDPLPADTTYLPGSIIVGGVAKTDAADADNAQFSANTVSVSLGNVASPANIVITFRATIN